MITLKEQIKWTKNQYNDVCSDLDIYKTDKIFEEKLLVIKKNLEAILESLNRLKDLEK